MHTTRLFILGLLMTFAAGDLQARTRPNLQGRTVHDVENPQLSLWGRQLQRVSVMSTPVALPAGAVQIDSTYYDLQDMGGLARRLVRLNDGSLTVTWQDDFCELDANGCPPNLALPNPHPERAMGVATRSAGGLWTNLGKVSDPDLPVCCVISEPFGGFGGLDVAPDGKAAVAQHMNEDGCDVRGDLYLAESAGGSAYEAHLTPIVDPSPLFPQVIANDNGSFTLLGEVPKAGIYDETEEFFVSYFDSSGAPLVCPIGVQGGPWTTIFPDSLFVDGTPAFPSLDRASDGSAGIAVTDFGGNVFLAESSDATFAPGTVTITQITSYTEAAVTAPDSTSTEYRPYVNCHLSYDGTTPHVVWSELQARRPVSSVEFFDHRSRIMHWSPSRGISVVKQVQAGEADRFDDLDNGGTGPLAGFNTISVDWPQVGFSDDGSSVLVAWLRFVDSEIDPTADAGAPGLVTGIGYGDIACSVSKWQTPWSPEQNLTQTPQADERFFSIPRYNEDGKLQLLFQASATNEAGTVIIGDRGVVNVNFLRRIAYLERSLDSATDVLGDEPRLPHVSVLRIAPNPARGQVQFQLARNDIASELNVDVRIYSVDGRLVSQIARGSSLSSFSWKGKDATGRPVSTGVYVVQIDAPSVRTTQKFVWVR